ncbi:MAG TPA: Fic family protein [Chloroflexota bacterium]|nr:Fic family protein [Chloroflexota bacterium]
MKPEDFQDNAPGYVIHHPSGYWAFVPAPLPPTLSWSAKLITTLSAADRSLGELAGLSNALPDPHLLIQPFMRREAVLSSRIEGTRASLTDLYAYEAVQLSLFEFPADVQEVRNYVQTLAYGLERLATLPVSLRLMRELHERLMTGVRGEQWTPGEFRRSQNWIGPPGSTLETATYIPPPVEQMHLALHDLETFIHATDNLPPLVKLGLVHYQFEAIHPFLDGNGRVGRLLMSLLLADWDLLPQPMLYLSAFFEEHRQAYYEHLLAISQRGDWESWLLYFLRGVYTQAHDSIRRIRHLQALRDTYREQFQTARAAARLLQVIDTLFVQPIFTISQISEAIQINYPTAQRYVNQLEEARIVQEITGQSRNRVYRAGQIMAAIETTLFTPTPSTHE